MWTLCPPCVCDLFYFASVYNNLLFIKRKSAYGHSHLFNEAFAISEEIYFEKYPSDSSIRNNSLNLSHNSDSSVVSCLNFFLL